MNTENGAIKFPAYLSPVNLDGLSPDGLRKLIGGRRLYLRGAAFVGQGLAAGLARAGFEIAAYLDKSPRLQSRKLRGRQVLPPEAALNRPAPAEKIFVIMSSGYWEEDMRRELSSAGLVEGRDFISSYELTPLSPSIDVAGVCNLRCLGCPRGNLRRHPPAGFMSADVYARVIEKLIREMPLLGAVQLYTWGEPLLNKELSAIIGHNKRRGILSSVSTNLALKADLESFVAARPELVRISCSGYGKNYELTHTGAKWELFLDNLRRFAELVRSLKDEIEVEFYYHLYAHNEGDDYEKIKALCEELDLTFRPITASLYPRENVIKLRDGQNLSPEARKQLGLLKPEARAILEESRGAADEPCLENRCFAINWNLNVRVCGVYYMPTVADNFLEFDLRELVRRAAVGETCRECAKHGAHSFVRPIMADQRTVKGS